MHHSQTEFTENFSRKLDALSAATNISNAIISLEKLFLFVLGLVIKSLQFSCFDDFAKGSIHVFGASKVRNSAQTNQVSKVIKTSAQTSKKISKIPPLSVRA